MITLLTCGIVRNIGLVSLSILILWLCNGLLIAYGFGCSFTLVVPPQCLLIVTKVTKGTLASYYKPQVVSWKSLANIFLLDGVRPGGPPSEGQHPWTLGHGHSSDVFLSRYCVQITMIDKSERT